MTHREIDALVATEVMGWEAVRVGYWCVTEGEYAETPWQADNQEWLDRMYDEQGMESVGDYFVDVTTDFMVEQHEWSPTEDIAAAIEVVEKMRREGWQWCIAIGERTFADVQHEDPERPDFSHARADADTVPLAICLAALSALGITLPEDA